MTLASSVLSLCQPRFQAGQLKMTKGVTALVQQGKLNVMRYLRRHLNGDWGDVSPEHRQANQLALRDRERLCSFYQVTPNLKLCLVTESDRSVTQALLSDEC